MCGRHQFRQNLPRRKLSISESRVEVIELRVSMIASDSLIVLRRDLFEGKIELPRLFFEQLLPDLDRLTALG